MPVLLLMLLIGIDFSRVFLGWINLQSMAKNAANFAADNPDAWPAGDPAIRDRYQALVLQDAAKINCRLPTTVPDPQFSGTRLGDNVRVELTCLFDVLTPVVSSVVGGQVAVGAVANFPVKSGGVTGSYGGGSPPVPAPVASLIASPTSGNAPLIVAFTDNSTNLPTSWFWRFGDGLNSLQQNPVHAFATAGTYTVTMHACNSGGCSADTNVVITANPAPTTGPIPGFTATPRSGPYPLAVTFTDQSTGTITSWAWSFGDSTTSTQRNVSHTYQNVGTYTVSLTVSDGTTTNTDTRTAYVIVGNSPCVIPNFTGVSKNNAQNTWNAGGFQTQVRKQSGQGNYSIQYQSLAALLPNPPNGCFAQITVGP